MKKIMIVIVYCVASFVTLAGDTNFVAQFDVIWKTHQASNILVFVEQNVATNKSPEVLYARGTVALILQAWSLGATNYWEQAIQIISTNNVYSEAGKTNVIVKIRAMQDIFSEVEDNLPTWRTNDHVVVFSSLGDRTPELDLLEEIAKLPLAEP